MNYHGEEEKPYCEFHPNESVVGVCALCLKERLLVLASKQGNRPLPKKTKRSFRVLRRKRIIRLPKVFALGPFLNRHRNKDDSDDDEGSIASHEDSFISVKFDDDGHASWDSKEAMSVGPSMDTKNRKVNRNKSTVVEHTKHSNSLKWKKRIGQLLRVAQWKRSKDRSNLHVGFGSKVGGAKGRRGWILRSLTRRMTTTAH